MRRHPKAAGQILAGLRSEVGELFGYPSNINGIRTVGASASKKAIPMVKPKASTEVMKRRHCRRKFRGGAIDGLG